MLGWRQITLFETLLTHDCVEMDPFVRRIGFFVNVDPSNYFTQFRS